MPQYQLQPTTPRSRARTIVYEGGKAFHFEERKQDHEESWNMRAWARIRGQGGKKFKNKVGPEGKQIRCTGEDVQRHLKKFR